MSTPTNPDQPTPDSVPQQVQPASGAIPVVQIQSLSPEGGSASVPLVHSPSSAVPLQEVGAYADASDEQSHHDRVVFHNTVVTEGPKQNPLVKYWKKVGGGSFLISLLIHAGLLVAAFFIVKEYSTEPKVDFLPGGGSKSGEKASQQLAQKVQNKKRSSLNKTTPMKKVVSMNSTSAISLPEVPMDAVDMPEMSSLMGGSMGSGGFGSGGAGGGFGKGIGIGGQSGFVSLPPSMKSRCSSAERLQKLKESGGTAECERAVSNALEYLKTKQKPDGGWGANQRCGMTGFALLCFLGRCETPESVYYGDNVMKAILYLIEKQKKNPNKLFSEATSGNGCVYEHGIATYALGEMYTLARMGSKALPGMREAFEEGVKVIIDNQQESGSWVYDSEKGIYANPGREDLSVAGWQYQALKAAKLTSLKIGGLHGSIDKTVKYLEGKQTKDGGIGGTNREGHYNQWALTGAGVLGLQTLATGGKKTEIKKAIAFAHDLFKKEPPTWETADLYAWYYYQQAFFQYGSEEWKYWNELVLPVILANQQKDGSWKPSSKTLAGTSGGPDNIYATALCTLMLEVYYRYLKVGDRDTGSMFSR